MRQVPRKDSTLMPSPFHSSNPSFHSPSCLPNSQKMEKQAPQSGVGQGKIQTALPATQSSSDLHYTIKYIPQLTQPWAYTTQSPACNKTTSPTRSYLPGMFITLSFTVPIWLVLHNLPYSLLYLAQSWSATYKKEKENYNRNHSQEQLHTSSYQH